jgi:glucan phosphoethanolaminetransferase (alkaline phosphatase superfamily)
VKLLLLAAGIYLSNHIVLERLAYYVGFSHWFPLAVFLGIWAVSLLTILYVAVTPSTGARLFWTILIVLSTLIGETYFLIVEDRITIVALDAMWVPGLVDTSIPALYGKQILQAALAAVILAAGLLIPPPTVHWLQYRFLTLAPLTPCFLLAGLIFYVAGLRGNETKGMPSQFYNLSLFAMYVATERPSPEKSGVDIPLVGRSGLRHIVLIVDESVSGDFIDLNVPRGTTPFLLSQSSSIANFGLATSASNCSNASNAILRHGANPATLGRKGHDLFSNPTLWKYAKGAGYETNLIDLQFESIHLQNFLSEPELALIDHQMSSPQGTTMAFRDFALFTHLREIMKRPAPQFIYVNKRGAHIPYQNHHPDDQVFFEPAMERHEAISDRARLVNSYMNAIRWTVDKFFQELLEQFSLANAVVIYTSDHGQNLLDDGKPVTHCRRTAQNMYEAVVPLMVFTGRADLERSFRLAAARNYNRASHFEIFPTLLILFGYEADAVRTRYNQSLFEHIENPLGFTSGPISGRFGRPPTWNSRAGLKTMTR